LLGYDIQDSWDDTYSLMKIILTIVEKSSDILKILRSADYPEKGANSIKEFKEMMNAIKEFKDYSQLESLKKKFESIRALNQMLKMQAATFRDYSESLMQQKVVLRNIANSKINFFRYIKNYQGTLFRKNKTNHTYRFYDEREWRYVPAIGDKRVEAWLDEAQYKAYRGTSKIKPLIENVTLNFTSDDIKYLMVKSSKEIPKLINVIQKVTNLSKNPTDAAILTTKILTVEQLNKDF
jgi:hypothetical protein